MTHFFDLNLIDPLQRALTEEGYEEPTPIQVLSIPPLLDGRDVLGCAQTGTGKTAAFALPVLQHLTENKPPRGKRPIRALILTPTRELAAQIEESIAAYGRYLPLKHAVIFGGVKEGAQIRALRAGLDILVATPGRLLDLMDRGHVRLKDVELFVLDEADRMLDMGFIRDVRRVLVELPERRQNLLFSATMPAKVVELAGTFLHDPVSVEVTPTATTVESIDQTVCFVEKGDKPQLLLELLRSKDVESAIVFTRTKHGANRLAKKLEKGGVESAAIHGNKSQGARTRALDGFKRGNVRVLVATDLASRGLDVDDVTHVFNFDLPNEPDSYVHRIGRTGRAGRSGVAVSFCDESELEYLRDIERLIGGKVPVNEGQPFHSAAIASAPIGRGSRSPQGRGGQGRGGQGRGGQGRGGQSRGGQSRGGSRGGGGGGGRGPRRDGRSGGRGGGRPARSGSESRPDSRQAPTRGAEPRTERAAQPASSRFSYSNTASEPRRQPGRGRGSR